MEKETIIVKMTYAYEVPKHKYNQLLQALKVKKLFHLEQYSEEFNHAIDTLDDIFTTKTTEEIEIDDGEY